MRCSIAVLMCVSTGCGLLLDLDGDSASDERDAGAPNDAWSRDGDAVVDAQELDAETADAAGMDATVAMDAGRADAMPALDAAPVVDALADDAGAVDPEVCRGALESATELGPGVTGSNTTCSASDVLDFACLGTTGAQEAYYYVNATTDVTVTVSSGGEFVVSRVSPDDCAVIACGVDTLSIVAGEVAHLVVEHRGGGCGATYAISAISGSP